MTHDIAIKNVRIVDGTGAPAFYGDIGVTGDKITAIGVGLEGKRVFNADGLTATPGFVDIHNHSDWSITNEPEAKNYIYQGVTTMLGGNCGNSLYRYSKGTGVQPGDYDAFPRAMDKLEQLPMGNNLAILAGHGMIRAQVVGMDDVVLSEADHAKMAEMMDLAMKHGAYGMSSGLIYDPGIFSTPDEINRLLKIVGKYGGFYAIHMRNESDLMVDAFLEGVEGVRGTGARLQICHLKGSGRQNFGLTATLLDLMTYYRRFGMDITCDAYPEIYCNTGLANCLPGWARARGHEGFCEMMKDAELRAKLIYELDHPAITWENILRDCTAEDTILTDSTVLPEIQGKTLAEVAAEMKVDPWEATIQLCEKDWYIAVISGGVLEEENLAIIQHPLTMICSDGSATPQDIKFRPHPRSYRSFVKPIYDFVNQRKLLTLEQAVHKMSAMPAQKIGLFDRGILRPGMKADIAIMDTETLRSKSTYEDPMHYAEGIETLLIGGGVTIENGKFTGNMNGKLLRKGRD